MHSMDEHFVNVMYFMACDFLLLCDATKAYYANQLESSIALHKHKNYSGLRLSGVYYNSHILIRILVARDSASKSRDKNGGHPVIVLRSLP